MFIGHFAVAFAAKKAAPKTSLGTLFMAAQLIDLLWPLFLLLGFEHVRIEPGNTAVTPLNFYDYPFTHSLVGAVGWSILLAFLFFIIRRDKQTSLLIGLVALSHWLLDAISHRPDLLLFPGSNIQIGLGLWNSFAATVIVELGMFLAAVIIYMKTTATKDKIGNYSLWILAGFLVGIYFANLFGPPPPSVQAIAITGNAGWLIVLWGYWIDRHRRITPIEIS